MSDIEPAATAADLGIDTGLEDFDTTDMVMPRLSIVQDEAEFEDNLTGERHRTIRAVMLGLIKGRILWDGEVNDGDKPLCKSYNFKEGVPNLATFPLEKSGFDALPTAGGTLPCNSCDLKEWGSHPTREIPWCSEQHTFPLLMEVGEAGSGDFSAPAILTVQRSAIKSSKSYLTGFSRTNTPAFTVVTEITLDPQRKGGVKYAVPKFKKVGTTAQSDWRDYAEQYRSIREYIQTPREADVDDGEEDAPKTSSAGASQVDEDDLPF